MIHSKRLLGAVAGIALGLATGLVRVSPLSAAAPGCPSDVFAATRTELAACGVVTYPLIATERLTDGGYRYLYRVGRQEAYYLIPPESFVPRSATAAQLSEYGIPTKPENPSLVAHWTQMVSNMHFVPAPPYLAETSVHAVDYTNWSGYYASGSFTSSEGDWNEPSLGSSCTNNGEATWTGLGAVNSGNLGQDGTIMGSNIPGLNQHQAWTEILPAGAFAQNLYATVGQGFDAQTSWSSPFYHFYLHNDYTGGTVSFYSSASSFDGSTADFIAERPAVSGSLDNLSNFGTLSYNFALANNNSINQYSDTNVTMTNGLPWPFRTVLATASSLSISSFTVTYQNCS